MTTHAASGLTVTLSVESTPLGGTRAYTLTMNQEVIDTTSDDSSRWEELLPGRRSWAIDTEALYIYDDTAAIYLEEHVTEANPAAVTVILTMPNGRTYSGDGLVTSIVISRDYEGAITASVSIRGTDALTTSTS